MTKEVIIYSIVTAWILFYLMYTIKYSIVFKTNVIFTGKTKTFHLIMIWLVPFLWIFLLKSLMKSTPGSFEINEKKNPESFTDIGLGKRIDPPPNF